MDELFSSDKASLIGFLICTVGSAMFSMSETAITGLGTLKAKHIIDTQGAKAKQLLLWLNEPSRVLTTILLFNTGANIVASAIATDYANRHFNNSALAVATGFTTFVLLIFSEIIPKTIGKVYTEQIALFAMKFVYFLYVLSFPLVWVLSKIANATIQVFGGGKPVSAPAITEEELEFLVNVGEQAGVFEATKQDMISGVFQFDEIKVREIMTPRTDMVAIEAKAGLEAAIRLAYESGHARIPVYEDKIDHVVGILLAKDLLQFALNQQKQPQIKLMSLLRKPYQVPESKLIMDVFKELKRTKNHMAIVIDEYGGTAGLITLEDMLEEIVGEIQDEHDEEIAKIVEITPGVYEVVGQIAIDEFFDYFDIDIDSFEEEDDQEADTLAGFMIQRIGDLPKVGQKLQIGGIWCEVSQVARHRIEKIRVLTTEAKDGASASDS